MEYSKLLMRDGFYDKQFDKIDNLKWYPYVGCDFIKSDKHIIVFAHNIPTKKEEYNDRIGRFANKDHFAKSIGEYTYCIGSWTKTFRSFIKGAVGLLGDYNLNSNSEVINRINDFVSKIAYINYIQDLVVSNNMYGLATREQREKSKAINFEILKILQISHCICWGKNVYSYIVNDKRTKVTKKMKIEKEGFGSSTICIDDSQSINMLKVYHPSMPKYGKYSKETHEIIESFLSSPITN
jgi:hypothetical protein